MSCDYHLLPHLGIQTLSPYVPGKSTDEVAKEHGITDIIKLASNENPLGCSPNVIAAIAAFTSRQIATYPISAIHPLRWKIAEKLGVDAEMITLSNGSDVLVTLLLLCFALHRDKHVITHDHAFITYQVQAQTLGIPIITTPLKDNWEVDIDKIIASCTEKTAIIFLANPNNPTGLLIHQADIQRLLKNIPETTILMMDEAYYEYVTDSQKLNTLSLLANHPNLVMTRTFSKAYGLAGLRLGFAVATPTITALLHRIILPFTVNITALVAGSVALEDNEFIEKSISNNVQGLKQMQQGLTNLGYEYLPTAGNFITFDCRKDALPLYRRLQQHGIIVRPLHPYGLNDYLRVTIGTPEQNTRFLDTLEELHHEE